MRIKSADVFHVKLPTRRDHQWAGNTGGGFGNFAILRLNTDEGLQGLGEAAAFMDWGGDNGRYNGESSHTVKHIIQDYIIPCIAGEDPFNIELIHDKMNSVVRGHHYAKAAVDMACYDLMGKATNLPAYQFLGGCYRKEIALAHSIGLQLTPDQVEAEAETVLAEGVKTIKLKVSRDRKRDIEAVKRLRKLGGPDTEITLDANKGWDIKTAVDVIRRIEEYEVSFVEQPVENIDGLAEVKRQVHTPIMADESAWTPEDIYELARKNAVDMISIYTTKPGGLHQARKVATLCEVVGFPANLNGSLETGVGNAANLHITAACKIINQACVVATNAPAGRAPTKVATHFYMDDIITEPYGYRDGYIKVPEGPGLGVELDMEKLKKYSMS